MKAVDQNSAGQSGPKDAQKAAWKQPRHDAIEEGGGWGVCGGVGEEGKEEEDVKGAWRVMMRRKENEEEEEDVDCRVGGRIKM